MPDPEWTHGGKTVAQLIRELQSFENQDMEARISLDGGNSSLPISLLARVEGRFAVIMNCQNQPEPLTHGPA